MAGIVLTGFQVVDAQVRRDFRNCAVISATKQNIVDLVTLDSANTIDQFED
jgi:hypothetical protein